MLIPFLIFIYDFCSMILPLKVNFIWKIFGAALLIPAILRIMVYRRTETGFDIIELPYGVTIFVSFLFNFLIVSLFILVLKDIIWILWKIILRQPFPSSKVSFFALIIVSILTIYGTWEGIKVPDVKNYDIKIPGIGKDFKGFKIAMIVDLHVSTLNRRPFVEAVVEKVNALSPDVILIPGDFVDGSVKNRLYDIEPLNNLKAPFGIFGTTGNHEYYFDFYGWLKEFKNLGINMLENQHVILESGDSKIVIAGVPDQQGGHLGFAPTDLNSALKNLNDENVPIILMAHRPEAARENAKSKVSLQISGHTHGGQMPILDMIVKKFNSGFVKGWYKIDNMNLYVSPGTSQWNGLPLRIFDPSEITLFTLN